MYARPLIGAAFVCIAFASQAIADDEPKAKSAWKKPAPPKMPSGTPAEQVQILAREYEEMVDSFYTRFQQCSNSFEETLLMLQAPDRDAYMALMFKIAADNPQDPASVDGLIWVVRNGRAASSGNDKDPFALAIEILKRDHLGDARIGRFCTALIHSADPRESIYICRTVMAKNPNDCARALAAFALAEMLRERASLAEILALGGEKHKEQFVKLVGEKKAASLSTVDPKALHREAEELLEQIIANPAYTAATVKKHRAELKVGDVAAQTLFRIRHLAPGKPAPELVGIDLDGQPLKLSDYRGKVVVVNFWATWCGPCMGQVPEEREIVKEFAGRPFVLLGINCDEDKEHARKVAAREKMSWKSFADGDRDAGPIQRQWSVKAYPEGYIIDHRGIIVGHFGGKNSKETIAEKIAEAEKASAPLKSE